MSLTGILLDVSQSMRRNIKTGTDQEVEPCFFKLIDDLVNYAVSGDNRVFVIGVGARIIGKEIFDVVGTIKGITKIMQTPATEEHVNSILDILEKNGARNVRKWARDVALIQDATSDYTAAVILWKLETDNEFLHLFVNDFLPKKVRDTEQRAPDPDVQPGSFGRRSKIKRDSLSASLLSRLRPATKEDIEEIVEKAKSHIASTGLWIRPKFYSEEGSFRVLKEKRTQNTFSGRQATRIFENVEIHSIFRVQDASSIIRGCFNEKELSAERKQELCENIEPFIYCLTPLYEALEKATNLFEGHSSKRKLLFVLSDGEPTDGDNSDINKLNKIMSKLRKAGVKIVSCFITGSTDIQPKRLYDDIQADWEPGARFLFSLSSKVPTQYLPRAILIKRGWTIDVTNNETKLFVQINHPDHLRQACEMAQDVFCSSDALSELLVSVDLDIYISQSNSDFEAKKQKQGTCYANASAAVLHLAMKRILGRGEGYPSFEELKGEMIKAYGIRGADTSKVLRNACQKYHLRSQTVYIKEAMDAIVSKRPLVARFRLTDTEWQEFSNFYQKNPTGILTQNEIDIRKRPASHLLKTSGHAVVFTSYNSRCLIFMNSWGQNWGDNGFFRVENAEVLQMEFFDVYWTLNELSEEEKENYRKHASDVAAKLMKSLEGLQEAEYTCPDCKKSSLVTEFTGALSRVRCPKCLHEFSTNDNTGNILALNIYLTSLTR